MRKKLFAIFAALVVALTAVAPAGAITGGQPDGIRHPYGALLLVPGLTFCSGTLIDEDVVLTAGHCTNFWSNPGEDIGKITEVWITFDSEAAVDPKTWMPIEGEGTWYVANTWHTHPDYVDEEWPFTADYGVVILDEPVEDITPAILPEPYLLDEIIGDTGQTDQRFEDVGYGQAGVLVGGGPYTRNFEFIRKFSVQRYNPSNGAVGTQDPMWLILGNVPAENKGAGCGGDSGSGIFLQDEDVIIAVHTGGYRMGYLNRLCGRMTSLNHRVELPVVLDWLETFID